MNTGWAVNIIYCSGNEGYDASATFCFSKKKKKLIDYIGTVFLFEDSPQISSPPKNSEPFTTYIQYSKEEALKRLREGKTVHGIDGSMITFELSIDQCSYV
jgi:hypothetical protein